MDESTPSPRSHPLPPSPAKTVDGARLLATIRTLAGELRLGKEEAARLQRLGLDDALERDFGLDSLARAELLVRLRQEFAGTTIDDGALLTAETPGDLLHLLAGQSAPAAPALAAVPVAPIEAPRATSGATFAGATTLTGLLDAHVAEHPERAYIRLYADGADAEDIGFRSLRDEALAVAGGLVTRGLCPGDRAAIMLPTCRGFFAAFFGILYAGGVPVPLYPPARPSQLEDHMRRIAGIVANAEATILVADPRVRLLGHLLRGECPALAAIATVEELAQAAPLVAPLQPAPGDLAFLQYTSGSTGQPKGVALTHANLLANLRAMATATGVNAADTFVSWLPLYHDMGLIGACLGALAVGFRLVLLPPQSFLLRPERWLWLLHKEHGTVSAAPNFAYEICAARIDAGALAGLDLSRWRLAFNGAETVAAGTLERFGERFAAYGFSRRAMTPVYGLAENSVGLSFPPPGRGPLIDAIERDTFAARGEAVPADEGEAQPLRVVCCGRVLPGHRLRIADARGRELPERRVGRVQFQGPSATSGYFRRADPDLFDGDWVNTGDLGYLADGELYLTGRAKDIIIRGGHNYYPQELEEAVGSLAGVRRGSVAVFAASDPRGGSERLIVVAETRLVDAADAADFADSAEYSKLSRLRDEIAQLAVDLLGLPADDIVLAPPQTVPKTSSGKIRRAACRERYEQGTLLRSARAPWLQVLRLGVDGLAGKAKRAWAGVVSAIWPSWAWGVFISVVPLAWLLVTLLPTLALRRHAARASARLALRLCGLTPRVEGLEQLAATPCVVVANHASYLDALILTGILPPRFTYVAKLELAEQPLAAIPLRRLGSAFVERFDSARGIDDTRELEARAAAGESLLFFPEGTFRAAPGLQTFRLGAFTVAARSGLPLLPLCLRGSRRLLRDGVWRPRHGPLEVLIGSPLAAPGSGWDDVVSLRNAARDWIAGRSGEDAGPR